MTKKKGGKKGDIKGGGKLRPLGDRVVVKALTDEGKKHPSGIIIPETVEKSRPERGRVIAVGAGRMSDEGNLIPLGVKVGDIVIFSKYGPDEIKYEGEEYFILREENILAIVN